MWHYKYCSNVSLCLYKNYNVFFLNIEKKLPLTWVKFWILTPLMEATRGLNINLDQCSNVKWNICDIKIKIFQDQSTLSPHLRRACPDLVVTSFPRVWGDLFSSKFIRTHLTVHKSKPVTLWGSFYAAHRRTCHFYIPTISLFYLKSDKYSPGEVWQT